MPKKRSLRDCFSARRALSCSKLSRASWASSNSIFDSIFAGSSSGSSLMISLEKSILSCKPSFGSSVLAKKICCKFFSVAVIWIGLKIILILYDAYDRI